MISLPQWVLAALLIALVTLAAGVAVLWGQNVPPRNYAEWCKSAEVALDDNRVFRKEGELLAGWFYTCVRKEHRNESFYEVPNHGR